MQVSNFFVIIFVGSTAFSATFGDHRDLGCTFTISSKGRRLMQPGIMALGIVLRTPIPHLHHCPAQGAEGELKHDGQKHQGTATFKGEPTQVKHYISQQKGKHTNHQGTATFTSKITQAHESPKFRTSNTQYKHHMFMRPLLKAEFAQNPVRISPAILKMVRHSGEGAPHGKSCICDVGSTLAVHCMSCMVLQVGMLQMITQTIPNQGDS